jgi:hypothetical protein
MRLSPAARACAVVVLHTQGSRTRPGLHAVARCAGLRRCRVAYPELADSHWATRCRPRRGLATLSCCIPRARGLALGYMLSPAARACDGVALPTQSSRTRTGLHAVARYASLRRCRVALPRARGLALGYTLSPAARACAGVVLRYPGLADSPCATRSNFLPVASSILWTKYVWVAGSIRRAALPNQRALPPPMFLGSFEKNTLQISVRCY